MDCLWHLLGHQTIAGMVAIFLRRTSDWFILHLWFPWHFSQGWYCFEWGRIFFLDYGNLALTCSFKARSNTLGKLAWSSGFTTSTPGFVLDIGQWCWKMKIIIPQRWCKHHALCPLAGWNVVRYVLVSLRCTHRSVTTECQVCIVCLLRIIIDLRSILALLLLVLHGHQLVLRLHLWLSDVVIWANELWLNKPGRWLLLGCIGRELHVQLWWDARPGLLVSCLTSALELISVVKMLFL